VIKREMNVIAIKLRPYTSDGYIVNEIWTQDCYLTCLINKGDRVLDIGAHIGVFSALALTRTSEVIAYEPLKANFDLLKANASKAELHQLAVSFDGTTKNKRIRLKAFNLGAGDLNEQEGEEVECVRFDDLLAKPIDFLKIDIEGSERGLLFHPEWLAKVKIIAIEIHQNMFEQFYEFLFNCGFRFIKTSTKNDYGLIVATRL